MPVNQHSRKTQKHAACLEEDVYVELLRTSDTLSRGVARLLRRGDLSSTQYNVLRILRGSPKGLPCGDIASRLISRDPDITRLLDRLEKRALIWRFRETKDRRMVIARITAKGLGLLARLDLPVRQAHIRQLGHLGQRRLELLAELLRACRKRT